MRCSLAEKGKTMDKYTATEQAYKNGYEKGYNAGKPKWIPVSERLPIPYEKVMTCRRELLNGTKIICNEYLTICYDETTMWSGDIETWKNEVTHWMSLPEPPKEGE